MHSVAIIESQINEKNFLDRIYHSPLSRFCDFRQIDLASFVIDLIDIVLIIEVVYYSFICKILLYIHVLVH